MHGTRQDPNSKPSQDASGTRHGSCLARHPLQSPDSHPVPSSFQRESGKSSSGGRRGQKRRRNSAGSQGPPAPVLGPRVMLPPLHSRPSTARRVGWGQTLPWPVGKERNPKRHACEEGPGRPSSSPLRTPQAYFSHLSEIGTHSPAHGPGVRWTPQTERPDRGASVKLPAVAVESPPFFRFIRIQRLSDKNLLRPVQVG